MQPNSDFVDIALTAIATILEHFVWGYEVQS